MQDGRIPRRAPTVAMGCAALLAALAAPARAQTTLFSDDFNRTGSTLGSSWTVPYGSFTTNGGAAVSGTMTAAGAGNWAKVAASLPTSDYAVAATLTIPSSSLYSGVVARSSGSDFTSDLYAAQISSQGTVNLYRRNAWTWTQLGSAYAGILAGTPYALQLVTAGSQPVHLEAWVNGTRYLAVDDSSAGQIASGAPGMENFDGGVLYDSFGVSTLGTTSAGPVAFWKLDDGSGTLATDSSGNGQDLTVVDAAWTAGDIGGALAFDGIDDYAVRLSPSAALEPTAAVAVSAWVRPTATGVYGGEVVSMGDNYVLRVTTSGDMEFFIWSGGAWHWAISSGLNVMDGRWHHAVGQYDGSTVQVWVDGSLLATLAFQGPMQYGWGTGLYLGTHGNGSPNYRYTGAIDQVRIYPRALSSSEIAALYAEGAGSSSQPAGSVNVMSYGATGTGQTDDTAAFQQAAATGQPLWVPVPSARYLIHQAIHVTNSVIGQTGAAKPEIAMLNPDGTALKVMFVYDQVTDKASIVLSGLHLNGGWDGTSPIGEHSAAIHVASSSNVTIQDDYFENTGGDFVEVSGIDGDSTALYGNSSPSRNVSILDNAGDRPFRCSVAIISADGLTIGGNTFTKTNSYVSNIDIEPDPNGLDYAANVVIQNNVLNSPETQPTPNWIPNRPVIGFWHETEWGVASVGYAGSSIRIQGNSGRTVRTPDGLVRGIDLALYDRPGGFYVYDEWYQDGGTYAFDDTTGWNAWKSVSISGNAWTY